MMILFSLLSFHNCYLILFISRFMTKLVTLEKISLKNHPEIKESTIQSFIKDDPSILSLGDVSIIASEKTQPSGGRLDNADGVSADDGCAGAETEVYLLGLGFDGFGTQVSQDTGENGGYVVL